MRFTLSEDNCSSVIPRLEGSEAGARQGSQQHSAEGLSTWIFSGQWQVIMANHFAFLGIFYCLQKEQQCGAQLYQSPRQKEKIVIPVLSIFKMLLSCWL